jgi:hypothetical protein
MMFSYIYCSGYIKIVPHRLVLEANGSLCATPTPFKPTEVPFL